MRSAPPIRTNSISPLLLGMDLNPARSNFNQTPWIKHTGFVPFGQYRGSARGLDRGAASRPITMPLCKIIIKEIKGEFRSRGRRQSQFDEFPSKVVVSDRRIGFTRGPEDPFGSLRVQRTGACHSRMCLSTRQPFLSLSRYKRTARVLRY